MHHKSQKLGACVTCGRLEKQSRAEQHHMGSCLQPEAYLLQHIRAAAVVK